MSENSSETNTQAKNEDIAYQEQNLTNIEITSENVALNVMVAFLNLAQRRGVFNMAESAKLWQCIQKFQQKQT